MIERLAKSPIAVAILVLLAGLVGAGVTLLWQGQAPNLGERAKVERIVHDYVLAHPEILPEAMRALQDRQTGTDIAANRDAILTPVGNAWAGNPAGDLTIVEYYDYNCGFCRASLPTIRQLIASDPKLRVVFRELPILSDASKVAARYSLVAARAGKFAAFHDAMYAGGPISDASLADAVRKSGLDLKTVQTAANDPAIDNEIETNFAVAKRLGMTGTPSWIIGDHVVSAALPLEELQKEIARARARG
jgi:protein-disulfide isomerase